MSRQTFCGSLGAHCLVLGCIACRQACLNSFLANARSLSCCVLHYKPAITCCAGVTHHVGAPVWLPHCTALQRVPTFQGSTARACAPVHDQPASRKAWPVDCVTLRLGLAQSTCGGDHFADLVQCSAAAAKRSPPEDHVLRCAPVVWKQMGARKSQAALRRPWPAGGHQLTVAAAAAAAAHCCLHGLIHRTLCASYRWPQGCKCAGQDRRDAACGELAHGVGRSAGELYAAANGYAAANVLPRVGGNEPVQHIVCWGVFQVMRHSTCTIVQHTVACATFEHGVLRMRMLSSHSCGTTAQLKARCCCAFRA